MNRLWVRISLTFIVVVIFVVLLPLAISISTRSFDIGKDVRGWEHIETLPAGDESSLRPDERLSQLPGWDLLKGLLRFMSAVAVLGIVVGVIISRTLTAPLNKLAQAAKAIGSQDLSRRVEVKGSDEIKAVAKAFNEMAAELENAETLRSNLLNDVAHELRTPLSVIQGNLRAILDDVYELDKSEVARIYDQTLQLNRIVDDLRELAQAEAKQLPLNLEELDVVPWVQEAAAAFRPIAKEKGVNLWVEILGEHPHIQADEDRLTQSLLNLLYNALQHTQSGDTITIQVEECQDMFCLRVQDTGEGIAPEYLPHVFDRFYRADRARSRDTGGSGLGLAIVRAIIEAHGGEITVTSEGIGKGSTFTIQLPL